MGSRSAASTIACSSAWSWPDGRRWWRRRWYGAGLSVGYARPNLLGGVARLAFGYSVGVLVSRLDQSGRLPRLPLPPLFVAASPLLLWVPALPALAGWVFADLGIVTLMPLMLVAALGCDIPVWTERLGGTLGRLSYPLYAVHLPLLTAGAALIAASGVGGWRRAAAEVLLVAGVVSIAWMAQRFYDEPVRRWLGLRLRARPLADAGGQRAMIVPIGDAAPRILCVLRIPPAAKGHGGSQRAWHLVEALTQRGRVDVLLVHRPEDRDLESISLEPLRAIVDSVTVVAVPAWGSIKHRLRWLPWRVARWIDPLVLGSAEAPRLGNKALLAIAAALPARRYDLVFAGRLPAAAIVDALVARGLLTTACRIVDLDDVLSFFKRRQLATRSGSTVDRLLQRIDLWQVERAEAQVAAWDGVSVCSDADVASLRRTYPHGRFHKVPNVIDRPLLPPPPAHARVLFVGNLAFPPNEHGLRRFVAEAWPLILAARPDALLDVVGLRPSASLRGVLSARGIVLHADVPEVEPFYRTAALVICPIFFGGGTRIKLLEAMAHGRAVVSTTIGAEGLELEPGRHALIADTMPDFATAVLRLLRDPALAAMMAGDARALQQAAFGPVMLKRGIDAMLSDASAPRAQVDIVQRSVPSSPTALSRPVR